MKFMLVHLSDIHITSQEDPITSRCSNIVDAIKNSEYSLDACVIVVTGDIAFAGSEEQYLIAIDFLDDVKRLLSENLSSAVGISTVPVHVVAVPGNHDCDFTKVGELRDILVKSILNDSSKSKSHDLVAHCTAVQDPFFDFLEAVETLPKESSHQDYATQLCYEYNLLVGDSRVKFLCYNTAWLSQLQESQGQLFFPADAVTSNHEEFDLVIASFHHPYNWIESNAARRFRERVESSADIILTGHEHVVSMRDQEGRRGQRNTCLEGGVLQDSFALEDSEFNLLLFDTELHQRKFGHYRWDGHSYVLAEHSSYGDQGNGLAWTDYRVNEFRTHRRFRLSNDMSDVLDDPGITLSHRNRGPLKLRDIFLYPDLMEMRSRGEMFGQRISGGSVRDLLKPNSMLLITGDTGSGKSCLGKMLFLDLFEAGSVPLLLDGNQKPPSGDQVYGYVEDVFKAQYDPGQLDSYRQLDRSYRAVIIDDFDKLPLGPSQRKSFLARLSASTGCLVVLSHDITSDLDELSNPSRFSEDSKEFTHYRIEPLGFSGRNKLAERWMLLGDGVDSEENTFVRKLDRVNETLNTIVGKNYVPSYPVYVLAVLQALDAATPVDITASTHGYFYELFIRTSLARGRTNVDFDIIVSYLAHLAYQLRVRRTTIINDSELRKIHEEFEKSYDIRRSYESLKRQLLDQNILVTVNDTFKFKYSYLYNYFVASYLKDHITEARIREMVTDMSGAMHLESNTNILLFLAHLSKDPFVIDELVTSSENLYSGYIPAELQNDISFLTDLGLILPEAVYEESNPRTTREAMYAQVDEANPSDAGAIEAALDEEDDEVDVDDPVVQLITALRHLGILGQILKNFPGSLEGEVKLKIARECYHLGLRSLSAVFEMVRAEQVELLREMAEMIKKQSPSLTTLEADNRAKETLLGLAHVLTYSMVKRIALAVGSPELSNTFERLLVDSQTPAFRIINSALELDHKNDFPALFIRDTASEFEDSPLPLSVLRHLVISHFHLFPVDYRTKQAICATLDIKYSRLQRSNPVPLMLPRGGSAPPRTR